MSDLETSRFRYGLFILFAIFCIAAVPGNAQEPAPQNEPPDQQAAPPAEPSAPAQPSPTGWRKFGESRPVANLPAQLTIPAGTWISVRLNEPLSSDRNRPGDVFSATLARPLVVSGYVVGRPSQTVEGRVVEAEKAGRAKGTSRLGIELTEISLVDGRQLPVRTQFIHSSAGTSQGRDAAAIGGTTAAGAAIGAAADGGFGAGIGAIAGAAASTIGVLLTRGRATELYPEMEITFRILDPVTISTAGSEQAFQPVTDRDYQQKDLQRRPAQTRTLYAPPPPVYGGFYAYPFYPYPYWGPAYWGPTFFFYSGPRLYHGRGFYRRW